MYTAGHCSTKQLCRQPPPESFPGRFPEYPHAPPTSDHAEGRTLPECNGSCMGQGGEQGTREGSTQQHCSEHKHTAAAGSIAGHHPLTHLLADSPSNSHAPSPSDNTEGRANRRGIKPAAHGQGGEQGTRDGSTQQHCSEHKHTEAAGSIAAGHPLTHPLADSSSTPTRLQPQTTLRAGHCRNATAAAWDKEGNRGQGKAAPNNTVANSKHTITHTTFPRPAPHGTHLAYVEVAAGTA
jgi:hypothetical protein